MSLRASNPSHRSVFGLRHAVVALALVFAVGTVGEAAARAGGGSSSGSRGSRTFSAPSATPTAPRAAAPIERSASPQPSSPSAGGLAAQPARSPGLFGGFGRGLMGGILGAGLIGLLFGHGLTGGLGGMMSMLGLMLQIGLLVMVAYFVIGWFRRRNEMANGMAPAGAGAMNQAYRQAEPSPLPGSGGSGFGFGNRPAPEPVQTSPLTLSKPDFDAFEKNLAAVQTAFGAEDNAALQRLGTPEMAGYFADELRDNAARGQINRIKDVRLVQGDLSESWRERDGDYATVAMRYSLIDAMIDRTTGRVISGSEHVPQEATELWTFRRANGAGADAWQVSAIQQTG